MMRGIFSIPSACRPVSRTAKWMIFASIICFVTFVSNATDAPSDDSINDSASTPPVIADELEIGGSGPEMVVVPIGGPNIENCIAEKGCEETITDIVRSMIAVPYAISRYEITFDDYVRFCEATGRTKPEDNGWGRGSRPIIFVAWKNALAYVEWLTDQTGFQYLLPSVIEWEHAARAGKHTAFWLGAGAR